MKLRQFNLHKFEIINEIDCPPEYLRDINGIIDFSVYAQLLESEITGQPFVEEMDTAEIHQLELLDKLSTKKQLTVGDNVIPIGILYVHKGKIIVQGKKSMTKITNIKDNIYTFENGLQFPHKRLSNISFSKLYMFDNQLNFDKFFNILALKFDMPFNKIEETN
jgi:hypothetical protein